MKALFGFLASQNGRLVRAIAGIILIVAGLVWLQGLAGWIVAIVGLVPLGAGVFDKCVFAPLFGLPFDGDKLRRAVMRTAKLR